MEKRESMAVRRDTALAALMLLLIGSNVVYVLNRGSFVDPSYAETSFLAHINLTEYLIVAVVFLAAPFVGACSGFRLRKSPDTATKMIGWLALIMFSLFFLYSALVYKAEYDRLSH